MIGISRVRNRLGVFFLIVAALVSGCASLGPGLEPQAFTELPKRVEIPDVPFHAQEKYQCGPATLAMALDWSGVSVTPDELILKLYSPARKGALQVEMMGVTRQYGRLAFAMDGLDALLKELAAGHPVIVLQNLTFNWAPTWHYSLVVGYDRESATIIMNSGVTQRYVVDWAVFIKTWKRASFWGLLILPPDILPASASEESHLDAVLGLEQVEDWIAASAAYEAALNRWPDSLGALMGKGNSRYALGDLIGAENAFRRAVVIAPDNGATHNNLAHVLAEQGYFEEALVSIGYAIKAGGPQKPLFEQTLREIKEKMSGAE
jgi:tetratricopeptide (TPR) repeat protein